MEITFSEVMHILDHDFYILVFHMLSTLLLLVDQLQIESENKYGDIHLYVYTHYYCTM